MSGSPGNELAELLWENGPAFRRAAPHFPPAPFPPFTCSAAGTSRAQELVKQCPASALMRDLDLPVHHDDDDDAVPWLHYPIIDGEDGGAAPLPPDYCSALLSGYSDLPAAPAPQAVANGDAREPSSSHGAVVPTTRAAPPHEPVPKQPRTSGGEGVMNFTFFSRPLQRPQGGERASAAATASNPVESTVVQTAKNRLRNTPLFSEQRMAWLQPPKGSRSTVAAPPPPPLVPSLQGETAASVTQRVSSEARAPEPAAAAATTSSVCSGNGDRSQLKRNSQQATEWSLSQDEDIDDEPGELRRSASRSTKRSRTAEVHNLSERRRRDRINEKMRALQELIPNCNKIDKASMLEEAIEYLKTLQLQVQMMSMGTGLCVPPMLLPAAAMPHLQMPPMAAHFPHLGPMRLGFGMSPFDMVQLPRVAGAQFPCAMIPGPPMAMPTGSAAMPMFGLPGQAMPSPAPFPAAPSHMANNAAPAEQTPSDAAAQGGAAPDAGDHPQVPVVPQGDQKRKHT